MEFNNQIVKVEQSDKEINYPASPFNPPSLYPEFREKSDVKDLDKNNEVYGMVRSLLYKMGLDKENFGKSSWRPFKDLVKKNKSVVLIKPNLVFDYHPLGKIGFQAMVTHASVIRPIIDYLLLEKNITIKIADCPLQTADFNKIIEENGLKDLILYYRKKGIVINLFDIRKEIAITNNEGIIFKRVKGKGDPDGYLTVDLKKKSALYPIRKNNCKLEITDYPSGTVPKHHNGDTNEYLIGKSMLDCDLFINIPKLKTHKKAGISVALKNLIGINGDKSWIAHHRKGSVESGGDEYEKLKPAEYLKWYVNRFLKSSRFGIVINGFIRKIYRTIFWRGKNIKEYGLEHSSYGEMEGSWYGNDTLWRTIIDLNNIVFFGDKEGVMHDTPQRKYLIVVDGIVSGEKTDQWSFFLKKREF